MYKYLIYKIYSWSSKEYGSTPVANVILTLAFVHFLHFFIILIFFDQIITPLPWFYKLKKHELFVGIIIYFAIFYFIIYNKEKWNSYIEEFRNESEIDRKRGNIMVIAFLVGSILMCLISIPVLFTIGKNMYN